ncbi:NB-ARC domain-containing protein, partial [Streptomyces nigra]|uniref:NB-ARC domain-containing protein n=1 Tax=Streptomyces nigra TaxID=1827580 RepID=UPI0036CF08BC
MQGRIRVAVIALLAGCSIMAASGIGAAINAATNSESWPGVLDLLRRYPWHFSIGLTLTAMLLAGVATWVQEQPGVADQDPPPPTLAEIPDWVLDRAEKRRAVSAVCGWGRKVGVTTLLTGPGGFGKTTLAHLACADRRIQRRFNKRVYFITIGRDVSGRPAIAAKVAEVTRFITGDTAEFDNPDLAGAHLGRLLDSRPRTLLVLDDVWEPEQLMPFLTGGRRSCARLVTTRVPGLLPDAHEIQVDEMPNMQARAILTRDLPRISSALTSALLDATGRWALLLRLTNRLIAEQIATGAGVVTAISDVLQQLRDHGPAIVDDPAVPLNLDDPKHRSRAVRATVEAAATLLPPGGRHRFTDLAVFAEDEAIPITLISALWQTVGGLSETQSRTLCRDLQRLSLISLKPENGGYVTLHDVIRDYLRVEIGEQSLRTLNQQLIDSVAVSVPTVGPLTSQAESPGRAWWQLREPYLLDYLIDHLVAAGRTAQAEAVASDIRWVEARLHQRGASAPWNDLSRIPTPRAAILARPLAQATHLLAPTHPRHALSNVLYSRLDAQPQWRDQVMARQEDQELFPLLVNQWVPPDVPDPSFVRALAGHNDWVRSVAVAPNGAWLASAGDDRRVRVWDLATSACIATLTGHADWVRSVAVAPNGAWLASGSDDRTVRIWDPVTGTCIATLVGHSGGVSSVALTPDGAWLASGSNDHTVRIWDPVTGTCIATLVGHSGGVSSVAFTPDGAWLASGSNDHTVRIWNPEGRAKILTGHNSEVTSVVFTEDGTRLFSGSSNGMVRMWDPTTSTCTATLTGHTSGVTSLATASDGTRLASGSGDGTVRIWDPAVGDVNATHPGQAGSAHTVVVAPDGTWLATGSEDGTVR